MLKKLIHVTAVLGFKLKAIFSSQLTQSLNIGVEQRGKASTRTWGTDDGLHPEGTHCGTWYKK